MNMKFKHLILAAFLFLNSCVYYNTFYNAEKYFKEANEMELRDNGQPKSTAIQKYNKTIKKCGIVLTDYKDSKYADDALFLIAKSFFYIGRNYRQSISKLEELIKFYPQSEFVPEAKLYLAQANYQFKKHDKAYQILKDFLLKDKFSKLHPRALKILATYNLEEENYVETEYYLRKIIEQYADSDEYENAYFLLGKIQTDKKNYSKANNIFLSLLKTNISRNIKFDSRYFISLNYLLQGEYQLAKKYTESLLKDEYRENKISRIRLIRARALSNLNDTDEAIAILNAIIKDNKHTNIAAEASYYLAELYFHNLEDYEKAIEFYNKVKQEHSSSKLVDKALRRSSVASQIIQYYKPREDTDYEDLVLQHFKLAEYYIDVLNQPDSALSIYNKVIKSKDAVLGNISQLVTKLDSINSQIDSTTHQDTSKIALPDSTQLAKKSLAQKEDSMKTTLENNIPQLEKVVNMFENEFIPYSNFVKLWINDALIQDSTQTKKIYSKLKNEFPDNKYTYAATLLINDKEVVVTTKKELDQIAEYNQLISHMDKNPEQIIEPLSAIADSDDNIYSEKAKFTLGYIYYFTLNDSVKSKVYFNDLLEETSDEEIIQAIYQIYNGEHYKTLERLPALINLENQIQKKEENREEEQKEKEQSKTSKKEIDKENYKSQNSKTR